jgi:WD40 repeat protein
MTTDVEPFGEPVAVVPLPAKPHTLDLSNDGTRLVVAMKYVAETEDAVRVYEVDTGKLLASTSPWSSRGAVFADDGDAIVVLRQLHEEGGVRLEKLPWRTPAPAEDLGTSPLSVSSLTRSRSGQLLAITGKDVEVFSLAEDRTIRFIKGRGDAEDVVACFSHDERSIYIAHLEEGQLIQQDLRSGEELARWPVARDDGGSLSVSPTGRFLVSQSYRGAALFDGQRALYPDGKVAFSGRKGTVPLFSNDERFVALHLLGTPWLLDLQDESGWLHRGRGVFRGRNDLGTKACDAEVYAWSREDDEFKHDVVIYKR